jgi:hypothetical protein
LRARECTHCTCVGSCACACACACACCLHLLLGASRARVPQAIRLAMTPKSLATLGICGAARAGRKLAFSQVQRESHARARCKGKPCTWEAGVLCSCGELSASVRICARSACACAGMGSPCRRTPPWSWHAPRHTSPPARGWLVRDRTRDHGRAPRKLVVDTCSSAQAPDLNSVRLSQVLKRNVS